MIHSNLPYPKGKVRKATTCKRNCKVRNQEGRTYLARELREIQDRPQGNYPGKRHTFT